MRPGLAHFADDPSTPPPAAPRPPAPGRSGPLTIPPVPKQTATAAMPPIERPRKRSSAPLALLGGGIGLLFLAVVAAAAIWYLKFRQPTEEVVPPPPPSAATPAPATATPPPSVPTVTGSLHIESEPAGATVTLNDKALPGVTPLDVKGLFLGPHKLKVELKGYAADEREVVLSEAAPESALSIPLSKAAPAMGTADIVSTPEGAQVKIGGAGAGQTPLTNLSLRQGRHEVEIQKEGYEPWTGTLVVRGRKARIDAQLRAVVRATPTPAPQPEAVDPNRTYDQADVDTPPRQTSGASASYPKDAPKLKSGQSVSVGGTFVVVNANGEVTEIQIRESGGQQLDSAVMAALAKRRYTPGSKKGVKVKVRVPFRQTFQAG
jgi:TonB family protein